MKIDINLIIIKIEISLLTQTLRKNLVSLKLNFLHILKHATL